MTSLTFIRNQGGDRVEDVSSVLDMCSQMRTLNRNVSQLPPAQSNAQAAVQSGSVWETPQKRLHSRNQHVYSSNYIKAMQNEERARSD